MTTITIEEAQAKLPELIGGLAKGEELIITAGEKVVARIVGELSESRPLRVPGFAKGMLTILSDDEDHLKDFAEYMP
jgi:antitoxin (DNA-binding transcriptional repressor) of toxin-antitoxin stability system